MVEDLYLKHVPGIQGFYVVLFRILPFLSFPAVADLSYLGVFGAICPPCQSSANVRNVDDEDAHDDPLHP